ncbi:MAG: hypothetical protein ACKO15_01320 [Burkholderiales bacterium]
MNGNFEDGYVDVGTVDEASSIATAVRASVKNPADRPPELAIEEASEIEHDPALVDSGFSFFPSQYA